MTNTRILLVYDFFTPCQYIINVFVKYNTQFIEEQYIIELGE